jgi:hypothetical protein
MDWHIKAKDLKKYPHFDSDISAADATTYVTKPKNIEKHSFYPFFCYKMAWNRWASKDQKGKAKERLIRYAARRDAYIFSYYRHLLAQPYEARLQESDLSKAVLAYRRIKTPDGTGKCNIHFAHEVFQKIIELKNCTVLALDISSYFDSIDHAFLKNMWLSLIGNPKKLPNDHFRVFDAITRYSSVDTLQVYQRLGLFGVKPETGLKGYLVPYKEMPKPQICKPAQFREQIAGGGKDPSIIEINMKDHGIPQGAPISDLLANMYLFEFDKTMNARFSDTGGLYCRYSDDIMVIVPGTDIDTSGLMKFIQAEIGKYGPKIEIKEKKTIGYKFFEDGANGLRFDRCIGDEGHGANGLEYLGFRFDGKKIYLRDSTLSNLWRKVSRSAKAHAINTIKRYPGRTLTDILKLVNHEEFVKRFGRVEDFDDKSQHIKNWTFWTYVRRTRQTMGSISAPIDRQLAGHRRLMKNKLEQAVIALYPKHVR